MTTFTIQAKRCGGTLAVVRTFDTLEAAKAYTWKLKRQFSLNDYMIFADYLSPKSQYVWGTITATAEERDAA